jgi:hypothetical protein
MGDEASNELEVAWKFGLPEFHGFAASLSGHYKRLWSDRGRELVRQTSELVGVTPESLGEIVAGDEKRLDVLGVAMRRATEVADPAYRDVLARLLAAACDDTKIDAAAYLAARVAQLEPVDLRGFMAFWAFYDTPEGGRLNSGTAEVAPSDATLCKRRTRTARGLVKAIEVEPYLTEAICHNLVAAGLLVEREESSQSEAKKRAPHYTPSRLGIILVGELYPDVTS